MQRINAQLAQREQVEDRREEREEKRRIRENGPPPLGMLRRDNAKTPEARTERGAMPEAPTINLTVGAPSSDGDAWLDRFVAFVRTGEAWSRADRLRSVVRIIATTTPDAAERTRLAKALDDKIAKADEKEPGNKPLDFFEQIKRGLTG